MALTTRQRNKLPRSAFAIRSGPRSNWAYPLPTRAQARAAGISEAQRQRMLRAAVAYAARSDTRSSYGAIRRKARTRAGATSKASGTPWGTATTGRRRTTRRRRRRTTTRRRRR
jgi:hypothetical protein